jgi:hypothetical protein
VLDSGAARDEGRSSDGAQTRVKIPPPHRGV